ncbi:TerB family tellurite resistance protein [Maribacter sp. CXY002]|uniref:TerB family tellurite resistance protein n=1 Tax=Maribacter luteocoastalis TaxID=3407671 RepID=UPI003B6772E4
MKLDISEKLAVVHVIESLIMADGTIHIGEINSLSRLMHILDFDSNLLLQARNLGTDVYWDVLKEMSTDKKKRLVEILEEVAASDGFVHEKEIAVMNNVISLIGIEYQITNN